MGNRFEDRFARSLRMNAFSGIRFKARDQKTEQEVAIKILRGKVARDDEAIERHVGQEPPDSASSTLTAPRDDAIWRDSWTMPSLT